MRKKKFYVLLLWAFCTPIPPSLLFPILSRIPCSETNWNLKWIRIATVENIKDEETEKKMWMKANFTKNSLFSSII